MHNKSLLSILVLMIMIAVMTAGCTNPFAKEKSVEFKITVPDLSK